MNIPPSREVLCLQEVVGDGQEAGQVKFPQLQSTASSILSLGKGRPFQAFLFSIPGWDTAEKDRRGGGKSLGGGGAAPCLLLGGLLSVGFQIHGPSSIPPSVVVSV